MQFVNEHYIPIFSLIQNILPIYISNVLKNKILGEVKEGNMPPINKCSIIKCFKALSDTSFLKNDKSFLKRT